MFISLASLANMLPRTRSMLLDMIIRVGPILTWALDVSYCQPGERTWPNYRTYEAQREINATATAMGHDRGGRYPHLFDVALPLFYDSDSPDAPPEVCPAGSAILEPSIATAQSVSSFARRPLSCASVL